MLNVSITDAFQFKLEVNYSRGTSFSDGELAGQYNFNPKADQWFSADYRYGFIAHASNIAIAKQTTRTV